MLLWRILTHPRGRRTSRRRLSWRGIEAESYGLDERLPRDLELALGRRVAHCGGARTVRLRLLHDVKDRFRHSLGRGLGQMLVRGLTHAPALHERHISVGEAGFA